MISHFFFIKIFLGLFKKFRKNKQTTIIYKYLNIGGRVEDYNENLFVWIRLV